MTQTGHWIAKREGSMQDARCPN